MNKIEHRKTKRQKRALRVRSKVRGTTDRPRLSVICTNKYTYLQVIDDTQAKTLAAANDMTLKKAGKKVSGTKTEKAQKIAALLAESLKKNKITKLAFDRGMRSYHGRVKAVAEEMRTQGINV